MSAIFSRLYSPLLRLQNNNNNVSISFIKRCVCGNKTCSKALQAQTYWSRIINIKFKRIKLSNYDEVLKSTIKVNNY